MFEDLLQVISYNSKVAFLVAPSDSAVLIAGSLESAYSLIKGCRRFGDMVEGSL